jgi:NAD(P)H-hydrate epimerase
LLIVSVAEMRELEAAAAQAGASEEVLQDRAGRAVADEVLRLVSPDQRVVVLAGHGNNGQDGAVAASYLAAAGMTVSIVRQPEDHPAQLLRTAAVGIDALTGIGARGALREPLATLVRELNAVKRERGDRLHVVAVDIPSGIDSDTGEVPGEAVWADRTVTLGAIKQGLLRFPAAERVGILVARDIGMTGQSTYRTLEEAELAEAVPKRALGAHKYRFGRVLVRAGSDLLPGAAVLCASGAARAGAGLVTVDSTASVRQAVVAHLPEATHAPGGDIAIYQSMVIGPGLGRSPEAIQSIRAALEAYTEGRVVIDADALYALANWPNWWERVGSHAILTPHAGELARLAGEPTPDEPPWAQASRLAQQWGCVLIAKGPFTSVARPDGQVEVWTRANPGLASGGTGDVLAGICAGLLAQGASTGDAARLAVATHALAAERVLQRLRWRSLLASDLLREIPAVLAAIQRR